MTTNNDDLEYQCGWCAFRGPTLYAIKMHQNLHRVQQQRCMVRSCSLLLKNEKTLKAHMRRAHGIDPPLSRARGRPASAILVVRKRKAPEPSAASTSTAVELPRMTKRSYEPPRRGVPLLENLFDETDL